MSGTSGTSEGLFTCPKCKCPLNVTPTTAMSGLCCPFCNHQWSGGDVAAQTEMGELLGWRAWYLAPQADGRILLTSTHYGGNGVWTPGMDGIEAECGAIGAGPCAHTARVDDHSGAWKTLRKREDGSIVSPNPYCSCGFYAARTRAHLLGMSYHRYDTVGYPIVMGQVAMWGHVLLASNGYRAQFVRPHRIEVPFAQMSGLTEYGVDHSWQLVNKLNEAYGVYDCVAELGNTLATDATDAPRWCNHCGAKIKHRDPTCPTCGKLTD